jgi:nucleoside-diphosphate-sugar epimerase
MRVAVTGAFGSIGENVVSNLLSKGYDTVCTDIQSSRNKTVCKQLKKQGALTTFWGDIRSEELVEKVVTGSDCVIHLAAIIPPASDQNPDRTRAVNLGGTVNLLKAIKNAGNSMKIVYASSVATYGHCTGRGPPKTANDLQIATDVYTETKIESEKKIRESEVPWTILRFGVVPSLKASWIQAEMSSVIFDIPLEQRIELIHPRDVGLAVANAVSADTEGKVLLIGGGKDCRMLYRDFVSTTLDAMGIGMLPDSAFISPTCDEDYFHTDWMDTEESQRLLQYQTRGFQEYVHELKSSFGWKYHFIRLFRPLVRRKLLSLSNHYGASR